MNLWTMLFSFAGRINRARYWLAVFAADVAGMLVVLGIAVGSGRTYLRIAIAVTIFLALAWINLAVPCKRLHDRDKSAWWLLLFYVVPAILPALGLGNHPAKVILGLASAGISIWAFVEIGCLRGTPGPNSYGSDPLQVQGTA
jgi:uncharacterized membrane protein YhaH (DUF805 family)